MANPCWADFAPVMKTCAVFFPFDLFGSGGAGAGVDLLVDELREILPTIGASVCVSPTQCLPLFANESVEEFVSQIAPDRQGLQVPAHAQWYHFDVAVHGST
jgi:hypothetical protein